MRAALAAIIFASIATAAAAQTGGVASPGAPAAKQQPPATSGMGATTEAPADHRQPTQKGLPPGVRKNEAVPKAPDPLGTLPKICNPC